MELTHNLHNDHVEVTLDMRNFITPRCVVTMLVGLQAASTTIVSTPVATAKLIANLGSSTLLNRLRPQVAGTATVSGSFGGTASTSLSMTVGTAAGAVTVTSVTLSNANWCTSNSTDVQCSVTFAGVVDAVNVLEVSYMLCCMSHSRVMIGGACRHDMDSKSEVPQQCWSLTATVV